MSNSKKISKLKKSKLWLFFKRKDKPLKISASNFRVLSSEEIDLERCHAYEPMFKW
jgi:hypothetical protein